MGTCHSAEHKGMLRDTLERFIEREMPLEAARQWDRDNHFPLEVHRKLAEIGLMALAVPEAYGGAGRDIEAIVTVIELLSARSMAVAGPFIQSACYAGLNLAEVGSEQQKQTLLPRVVEEGLIFAYGISEPDVGADVAAVRCTGRVDGETLVINGSKRFCSGARIAQYIYTLLRTGSREERHHNLSLVLVPTETAGITYTSQDTLGLKGSGTYDVSFAEVAVPLDHVVGGEGALNRGWPMLVGPGLDIEKLVVAAMALGIATAAVDEAWRYAEEREQFGKPISSFQSVRHMLAEAKTRLHACRSLTYQTARQLDRGEPAAVETAMAKLFVCDTARDIVLSCQQLMGAYGYVRDFDMERHVRDILVMPILGGSSAIQKNNICSLLKLRK